jgi:hypothetical protein
MERDKKYRSIIDHYEGCFERHGDTPAGVDWPNAADAETRYKVMLDVVRESERSVSLLDFGCGSAHLYEYLLRRRIQNIEYSGLDASHVFVEASVKKHSEIPFYCMDVLDGCEQLPQFDYVVMNGVFTEKRDLLHEEMFTYFKTVVPILFEKAKIGIAFNVMSKAVDWERDDLFHLSTDLLIDFLVKNVSRNYIIRSDYGLYEYTTYVYR